MLMNQAEWAIALGILGAILGSFVATLAIRWPQGRSVMRGRSACDACGKTLTARELVPIASALLQRGRCRSCAAPIDPAHRRIELIAAGIGVTAGLVAPGVEGVCGAVFGWLLLALAALDLAAFWLPDALTAPLAATAIVAALAGLGPAMDDRLIGGAAGFALLWLVGRRLQARARADRHGRRRSEAVRRDRPVARLADVAAGAARRLPRRVRLSADPPAGGQAGRAHRRAAARRAARGGGLPGVGVDDSIAAMMILILQAVVPLTLGAIGPQELPREGCAAYLWSLSEPRRLIAMAEPDRLRLDLDGKAVDLPRVAAEGVAGLGLSSTTRYATAGVAATVALAVVERPDVTKGGFVSDATLTLEPQGKDATVVPVAGMVGCR